jgi:threonine/homoserine/homoserine lactone efflux protein
MEFELSVLIAFVTANAALNFTPGPAVLKVVSDSITNGVYKSHASMAGVFAANLMYALLAIAGMSTLIFAFPQLFEIIKWCGVLYLCYLAFKSLLSALTVQTCSSETVTPSSCKRLFWTSFFMQGANPKSVLFFCAMLPTFAGDGEGFVLRMMVLAVTAIVLEYPALLLYSVLASRARRLAVSGSSMRLMKLLSASMLGIAATMIARTSLANR